MPPALDPSDSQVAALSENRVRVGDAERDETAARLSDHYAAGRLARSELDERTTLALGARTQGDLDQLMNDLPSSTRREAPLATTTPAKDNNPEAPQRQARLVWRQKMLIPWAVFGVFFIVLWAVTGVGYFWPMWPILGWGIAVVKSGLAVHTDPQNS